jgi:serine/threonine protein kinase
MRTYKDFYTLDAKPLGIGGQAEVFRARDRKTGQFVALKRVLSDLPDNLARMRREINVQQTLRHPNIMPIIRHSSRFSWYTMPIARRCLKDLPAPVDDAVIIPLIRAAAEALAVAHAHSCIHRDITPSNLLDIGEENANWVLSDWGLVRRHGLTTQTRTRSGEFGTVGFAAPETWVAAHDADHLADIYSLGRVLAWCATGSTPIPNVPLVPEGRWRGLVEGATAHRPQDRYQSAESLLEALTRLEHPRVQSVPDIPGDILSVIRAEAERTFPNDYSTRKYRIDQEVEAWRRLQSLEFADVPSTVVTSIVSAASSTFPRDFSTCIYRINAEVKSWRELRDLHEPSVPGSVLERILTSALSAFPRDFSTQLYRVKQELHAWRELET